MSDIIIYGMEMPKSCDVCPFVHENDDLMSDDYRFLDCGFPGMGMFVTDYIACRHPDCQLHELPPHGRLIDADALHYNRIRIAHADGLVGGYNAVVMSAEIKDAPTVIPASEEMENGQI